MNTHRDAVAGDAYQLEKFNQGLGGFSLLLRDRSAFGQRFEPANAKVFYSADEDGPEASSSRLKEK
jgi:hypothetical protein